MGRLQSLNRTLLFVFLALWTFCFILSVNAVFRRAAIPSVYVSAAEDVDDYPIVTGFDPAYRPETAQSRLHAGDRLLRLGDTDLRGVDGAGFFVHLAQEVGADRRIGVVFERAGERRESSFIISFYTIYWPRLPVSFAFAFAALLLLLRARPSPLVDAFTRFFICTAFLFAYSFGESWPEKHGSLAVEAVSLTLFGPLALRVALLFPHGASPTGPWTRIWPWFFAAIGPLQAGRHYGVLFSPEVGRQVVFAMVAGLAITLLAVATRTYRGADPIGRRQLKWSVLGLYCALVPPLVGITLYSLDSRFHAIYLLSSSAVALYPLFLLVAVARYNLFDVDHLISGTASYTLLVILLATGGEVLVEPLAAGAGRAVGLDPATAQVAFVALLAAALVPAQRAWRPYVDRIFFAEGRSLEARVEQLLEELPRQTGVGAVMQQTAAGIEDAFRPDFCVVYERAEEVFEPTCLSGSREFPVIRADSQNVRMLETKLTPVRLDPRGATPTPADEFNLPVSGAAVIMPLRSQGALAAFLGIGPKRSGDVYTSTDLSLLSAVAHAVSFQLEPGNP